MAKKYIDSIKRPDVNEIVYIKPFNNKKYIFIGDSYTGMGLGTKIVEYTGITATIFPAGGGCFSGTGGTYTFLTALQAVAAEMTAEQKAEITDIFVLGGVNEYSFSRATIASNMETFDTYVRSTFPNARVTLGMIGYAVRSSEMSPICSNVIPTYKAGAHRFGWNYISNANGPIHMKSEMSSDGIHPNSIDGLAKYVANYIKYGTTSFATKTYSQLTPAIDTITAGVLPTFVSSLDDGICSGQISRWYFIANGNGYSFVGDLDYNNKTLIGTFSNSVIRGVLNDGYPVIAIPVVVIGMAILESGTLATYEDCDGIVWLIDDKLYLSARRRQVSGKANTSFTSNSFQIGQISFTVPADYC